MNEFLITYFSFSTSQCDILINAIFQDLFLNLRNKERIISQKTKPRWYFQHYKHIIPFADSKIISKCTKMKSLD